MRVAAEFCWGAPGRDDATVLEHLEKLIAAETIDDAWSLHVDSMATYGFDRLIYGLSYEASTTGFGALEDMMILSNHSPEYLDRFLGDGLFRASPMLRWAEHNVGAASWRQVSLVESTLKPEERAVLAFNRKMDVTAGYTISLGTTTPCGRALISLVGRSGMTQAEVDSVWASKGREISVLNSVVHLKLASLPRRAIARKLTHRQREVLQLIGAGKTSSEIAQLFGVSQVTIEKHLRLAREQLGAETSAQALLKATVQGQIFLPQPSARHGNTI